MKKYTVVFRETRECEMQDVEAASKSDAIRRAEEIMDRFGHENWTSLGRKVTSCRVDREEVK